MGDVVQLSEVWKARLLKNKEKYAPCLNNAVLILTHEKPWRDVIAYDAFSGVVVKKKQPPWPKDMRPEDDALGDWTYEDSGRAAVWIAQEWNCSIYTSVVDEAVRIIAARWTIHPIRDYLNALTWDRKPRLDDFLVRVAGAEDNRYVRAITKSFFLGAVARIMRPGSKVDTVLILEGDQGVGKSTLFRILASDDWFLDTVFNIGGKDGYQALRQKWIIEFGELASLGRADFSRVKAFISSVKDSYRPPYGRTTIDFLRQCVFAGTVNPDGSGYLNDDTGARRFWPVKVGKIDLKAVRAERDQLWAEAFIRYRNNESWHLRDPKLLEIAAAEAAERRESEPWETHFREYLFLNKGIYNKKTGVTIPTLLTDAVNMTKDKQDRTAQIKAGKALRAIGWTDMRRGTDDVRRYFPAGSLAAAAEKAKRSSSNPPIKIGGRGGGIRKGKEERGRNVH